MSIEVNDLTKIYGTQKALDGISFSVRPGEILGFLGPNGAGKSTTMKILTGFIPQTSGSATVCGLPTNQGSLEVKRLLGYLPELNPLYTDMFIKEYLLFSAGLMGIRGAAANKAAEDMIERTGITPERKKKIAQLSKGYKQRVGLAAAMLHNPEVLILDEPTSGLDPNQVIEIRNLIRQMGEKKTVIFSTHIMQEVEALCSRVVIINKGKLVANDQISGLQGKLRKQFILNVEFKDWPSEEALKAIPGVIEVIKQTGKWQIKASTDVREALAVNAAKEQWIILSMQAEEQSLEDVFQQLTK